MPHTVTDTASQAARVAGLLEHQQPPALFVSELVAQLRPTGLAAAEVESALATLATEGQVLVTHPAPPDPHLASFDLRIAALRAPGQDALEAEQATQILWDRWLRGFLASHRCQ